MTWRRAAAVVLWVWLAGAPKAQAHPLQFAVLQLTERADGRVRVSFRFSGSEARPGGVEPELPASCKPVGETMRTSVAYGEARQHTLDCGPEGLAGRTVGLSGLDRDPDLQGLIRVEHRGGHTTSALVSGEVPTVHVPETPETASPFGGYLRLGVQHILEGIDHLLFVLGLMLLVGVRWALVGTITAFTVGHSITLALAVMGLVRLPEAPVEGAIGLSILLVAVELARERNRRTTEPSLTARYPGLVAGAFGLLHGLGFAGALMEVGLPRERLARSLLGFNLGVELGQLLFVGLILGAMLAIRRLPFRPLRWPRTLAVYVMGSMAVYFVLDRLVT